MKITSIDVFDFAKCLNYEDCAPVCIRINTDEGISGFGEVGLAYGNAHNAGVWIVKDFGQLIIGMDPLNSEAIREKLFRTTFWGMGGGTVINAGMSAIDIALWDIKGKYYKAPVYQLLGQKGHGPGLHRREGGPGGRGRQRQLAAHPAGRGLAPAGPDAQACAGAGPCPPAGHSGPE